MPYEVILGPAAIRTLQSLPESEQRELAGALREELDGGPNADAEYRFECDGNRYTATPLSFKALTAVHRSLTTGELEQVTENRGHPEGGQGFYVIEIRSGESAFHIRRTDLAFARGLEEPPLQESLPARLAGDRMPGRSRRRGWASSSGCLARS